MATTRAFELVASHLEQLSGLGRLPARGLVRYALKQGGLDAESVGRSQLRPVVATLFAPLLRKHGIAAGKAESVCIAIGRVLEAAPLVDDRPSDAPEMMFERLDGAGK